MHRQTSTTQNPKGARSHKTPDLSSEVASDQSLSEALIDEAEGLEDFDEPSLRAENPMASSPENGTDQSDVPRTEASQTLGSLSGSTGIISICVIISRITGFARTWAMAYALGATFLASSYQVANNLPDMLYELVMGGMLATAFLPVYVSLIKNESESRSNAYASNLLTIVVIGLGILSVLCMVFPQIVIFTQSFYSDQQTMGTAILFFQFFAIQAVFYGASTIISGLLNAHRDYFWSSAAPIANNIIVIATFIIYAQVVSFNETAALYVIAIGNPLGVFAQLAFQLPALYRNHIHLRPRIDLKDPALKETVSIGVPALLVTVCSFITVSVMNAAAYAFADNGPSILAYARLWYTLPYSFLAIPITTTLFTELADLHAAGNREGIVAAVTWGSQQIVFLLVPFMLFLMVFSFPLVSLYHVGAFTDQNIVEIGYYLIALVVGLPLYGLCTYQQKIFSALRKMKVFAIFCAIACGIQVLLTVGAVALYQASIPVTLEYVALASAVFYAVADGLGFWYLKRHLQTSSVGPVVRSALLGLGLGALGALAGFGVLSLLTWLFGPYDNSVLLAFVYVVISGLVALMITFGLALKLQIKEVALIDSLIGKVTRKFKRS